MYQHTVVSAAPACGVGVPIRSHVQALWQRLARLSLSFPLTFPILFYSASSFAHCAAPHRERMDLTDRSPPWTCAAPHSSRPAARLSSSSRSDQQNQLPAPHPTTTSSCAKARKGERAGLESRSNPSGPTFSQGKVQHNPECRQLREGSDSEAIALRENARSYNNALSLTLLAAHFDQTRLGILGPRIPVVNQRSSLCSNVADRPSRHRHSTWTQRRRQSHTKAYFDQARVRLAQAGDTAKEWVLRLCLPPGRDRRTHNLPPPSTEMTMLICDSDTNTGDRGPQELIVQVRSHRCPDGRPKYQVVSSLHPSAMPLRYPTLFAAEESSSHLNTPLYGFHQAGPPIARNREQIDNGVQLREVLPVSVWMTNEEDKDRDDEDEDREEGDEEDGDGERQRSSKGVEVASLAFTILCALLAKGDEYFSIPHCTHGPFLESTARHHAAIPGCDGVRCPTWKASAAHHDDVRPRLTGNQGCTGADKAWNRPDLIARVFEAKSGNKRHAGCFGDECKMNGFCFFAVFRVMCERHEIALEPHWFRVQTERIKRCNSQAKKDY
ncbi:BQ5605_C036g11511 [Microbotryum silenes-dioicae]|uniref:BQ5605_C036g11511 protein n=1 Tax=Microbotryum silenes-dioicae TaxID=796604 RepID=A0A2X0PGG5_9BASI|nr:BQ5605_C036g11511 [Microbotryum silenes-dioicae]